MIIGETHHHHHHQNHRDHDGPPPWLDPISSSPPPSPTAIITALHHHLLSSELISNDIDHSDYYFPSIDVDDDDFFMYDFKVRMCTRVRAHDWTECPFAHPGEKARRRDPRRHIYSGSACSDFRKGGCHKGDSCEFAHGVFECWLHPTRYRTQPCKDGPGCRRRVCFFAHHPHQLRAGSGLGSGSVGSGFGSGSVCELIASLRNLQLSRVKSMPRSWAGNGLHVGSPRGVGRPGFLSLPTTPNGPRLGYLDWGDEEGPLMERVESGRELRVRMFEKLSKENPLDGPRPGEATGPGPDLGWVSDLIR